ncbi:hypothetical protein EGW08_002590 [Elysia chlorotica]|uniref:Uncharacterized protein n=1 Tax=Elysia chlorotica TaxID=188477 RepID=A0A433U752_ELYCH|nr:hypothetical protein EGW08_002590 [Elysia chlorotica]
MREGKPNVSINCSVGFSLSTSGQNSMAFTHSSGKHMLVNNLTTNTSTTPSQSTQKFSKRTRLSTASIPRSSYLKMLRDDVPKEKGSVSLISNRSGNVSVDLKHKPTPCNFTQVTTVAPVFVTTTLRTASGPVAVNVRTQGPCEGSGAGLNSENQTFYTDSNLSQQSQSKPNHNDYSTCIERITLQKSKKDDRIPPSSSRDTECHSSVCPPSAEVDRFQEHHDSDSGSDSDFLHDSEEQDLKVLGQLLQQHRNVTSTASTDETWLSDSKFVHTADSDQRYTATHIHSKSSEELKGNFSEKNETGLENHEGSGIGHLKIESVFSLNQAETGACDDPISHSKNYPLQYLYDTVSMSNWESAVKPCFCVIQRLSETDIERLTYGTIDRPRESVSQCSDHCRRRTLDIMCSLNLLPCKSKPPFTLDKDENEMCTSDSMCDQETENGSCPVSQKQLLREKLKIAQQKLSEYLKSKSVLNVDESTLDRTDSKKEDNFTPDMRMKSVSGCLKSKSVLNVDEESLDRIGSEEKDNFKDKMQMKSDSESECLKVKSKSVLNVDESLDRIDSKEKDNFKDKMQMKSDSECLKTKSKSMLIEESTLDRADSEKKNNFKDSMQTKSDSESECMKVKSKSVLNVDEESLNRIGSKEKDNSKGSMQTKSDSESECMKVKSKSLLNLDESLDRIDSKKKDNFKDNMQTKSESECLKMKSKSILIEESTLNHADSKKKDNFKDNMQMKSDSECLKMKPKSVLNESLNLPDPNEEDILTADMHMNSGKPAAAEEIAEPIQESNQVVPEILAQRRSDDSMRDSPEEKRRACCQTVDNSTIVQSPTFEKAMSRLQRQVEIRRKQMLKRKHSSLKSVYPNVTTQSANASISNESRPFESEKVLGKQVQMKGGIQAPNSSPQLSRNGELAAKDSVFPRVKTPIVAQLLPAGSISTKVTPSENTNNNDADTTTEGRTNTRASKRAAKVPLTPVLPGRTVQQDPASANKIQSREWSVKISEALKSLHSYLKATGKQITGTEPQHFLLRIGGQHVLVSVPPTGATPNTTGMIPTSTTPHNGKGSKANSKSGDKASTSGSFPGVKCKDSGSSQLVKIAGKRKAESLINAPIPQASGDCSNSKKCRISNTGSVTADKNTTQPKSTQKKSLREILLSALTESEKETCSSSTTDRRVGHEQSTSNISPAAQQTASLISQSHTVKKKAPNSNAQDTPTIATNSEAGSRTQSITCAVSSSEGKQTRSYADPSSFLSHLPLNSSLLPIPKRNLKEGLSEDERVARRAMLEKKYPLPPGVIIKVEYDAPADAIDNDVNSSVISEVVHSSAAGTDEAELQNVLFTSEARKDSRCNAPLVPECPSGSEISPKSVSRLNLPTDTGSGVEITNDDDGTVLTSFASFSPEGPPPLIPGALSHTKAERSRKRPRKSRSTTAPESKLQVNQNEHPPLLQPMCNPTPEIPPTPFLCTGEVTVENENFSLADHESDSGQLSKKQRLDRDTGPIPSTSSSSLDSGGPEHTPERGFRATEVSVSKNIRIQRLKELLKQKEQEIESLRKTRLDTWSSHLNNE